MNVAIFGGTFDPIHRGHVAVARAARERFDLKQILFVPAGNPPHKDDANLTAFHHRYAMVALAVSGEREFVPSLLEDPEELRSGDNGQHSTASYSIDTVRRLKSKLKKSDRLFFIIGIDAFLDLAKWRSPEDLLRETEFIVASRPGFSLGDVGRALPESLRPPESVTKALGKQEASGDIVLPGATLHLLANVHETISATRIRAAAAKAGRNLENLVGSGVAEYIRKTNLYRGPKPEAASVVKEPQAAAPSKAASASKKKK